MRYDKGSWGNWITEGWTIDQAVMSAEDKAILRELAKQFRQLCAQPQEEEKIRLWTAHNDLEDTRPLILVDMEHGWNEVFTFDRDMQCSGYMAQDWEMWLRKEIFYATKLRDDKPLTPVFYLPHRAVNTEWGINEEQIGNEDKRNAYAWEPIFRSKDEAFEAFDVDSIEDPYVEVDWEATNRYFEIGQDVFDGILSVEFRTWWFWSSSIVHAYAHYRGIDGMMIDFYDYPDRFHEMMQKFVNGYMGKLRWLEQNGLLYNNAGNCFVGSGGLGFTNQLHPNPQHVLLKDMWGLNEAQEATGISGEIYGEFIFPYHKQVAEMFGFNCHACCEQMEPLWEYVQKIPRLRRVSVSQWTNIEMMSEFLGRDYVYSYKACSSDTALPQMNEDVVRGRLQKMYHVTKDNHVEIVLKDLHTIGNNPQQICRWVEIAREEMHKVYGS
ncbi:MAG: hypothetical protein ACOYJC_00070 [Christensenellales bacterium]|jgi:hypothetical protein